MNECPLWGQWAVAQPDPSWGQLLTQTALDFAFPTSSYIPRSPLSGLLITLLIALSRRFFQELLLGRAARSISLSSTFPGVLLVGSSHVRDGHAAPAQPLLRRHELDNAFSFLSTTA